MKSAIPALFCLVLSVSASAGGFVVHEWGTFTAVAGQDGAVVDWRPLAGPSDLPSFVYSVTDPPVTQTGRRHHSPSPAGLSPSIVSKNVPATVRMETPVLYFYAEHELKAWVQVGFPDGQITEWYPQAQRLLPDGGISWGWVHLLPEADVELIREDAPSHYYPAREVDSMYVRRPNPGGVEHDRMLFYRGIGDIELSLDVSLRGDEVRLFDESETLSHALVFESSDGLSGVTAVQLAPGKGTRATRPALHAKGTEETRGELRTALLSTGLYEKEVEAMLATWDDDWFEDGLRVFYLLPQAQTDRLLPLTITPKPTEIVRTMVGRIEIITPEMEAIALRELRHGDRIGASSIALTRLTDSLGRFAEPTLQRLATRLPSDDERRPRLESLLAAVTQP